MLAGLAERVILSWGWPRRLMALAAGAVGALALEPLGLFPALVLSMTLAVWLLDGTAGTGWRDAFRSAFALGWWFGFGFFLAGLWWLGAAFLVEADKFAWALPLGVVGLPAGLALFHALAFAAARLLWSQGASRILVLAAALGGADWLRGHVLTGFPWNSYGMALGGHLWTAQAASILGLYGLGLLAVAIAASPATLGTTRRRPWASPLAGALVLTALAGYGAWRLPPGPMAEVPGVRLRIMQPNLPQDAKFRPENAGAIMQRYLSISDRATSPSTMGVADVTHLIWPESAFPFALARQPAALAQIAALLPPGVTLVTGAARALPGLPGESGLRYRNSIHVVADDGTVGATYDKVHLVPFGEYLPLARQIEALAAWLDRLGIRQFVAIPGGFEPGEARLPLAVPGLPPVAALVCYEAIFPGAVTPEGPRPGVMLNVTNDAWFGDTPGPHQHFAQARLRTIEEGLPLVRAANSGISAVIDPYGRIVASLPLSREGVIDSRLPIALANTIYARYPDVFFAMLFGVFALLGSRGANRRTV